MRLHSFTVKVLKGAKDPTMKVLIENWYFYMYISSLKCMIMVAASYKVLPLNLNSLYFYVVM